METHHKSGFININVSETLQQLVLQPVGTQLVLAEEHVMNTSSLSSGTETPS